MPLDFDSEQSNDSSSRILLPSLSSLFDDENSNQSELSWQSSTRKRPRLDELTLESPPVKKQTHRYRTRLAVRRDSSILRSLIIARFNEEFQSEDIFQTNRTNQYQRCRNRLDGLIYTIKSTTENVLGTTNEENICREIAAHSLVNDHEHFIRYYSSWIEPNGRFFMQFEYSSFGSLDEYLDEQFDEDQLKVLLHQIADALNYLHRNNFAHLNLKPSTILVCSTHDDRLVYKLMDLSHSRSISEGMIDDHDDPTYLPLEWRQTSIQLDKIDLFSLGLILYVCSMGHSSSLPSDGSSWIHLRKSFPMIDRRYSKDFQTLLVHRLCHLNPNERPSAEEILFDSTLHPSVVTNREFLQRTLKFEREQNRSLKRKLLDQYLQNNASDSQILSENLISPHSISNAMFKQQQMKSVGSNMFRYYSSVI